MKRHSAIILFATVLTVSGSRADADWGLAEMVTEEGGQRVYSQHGKLVSDAGHQCLSDGNGHSIAPLLNLYDFAKDHEVKLAAKACLDFFAAAGAVKYWRGGFNGPTKRDYNHAQPFGGSAANALWVWFGDRPEGKTDH